MCKLKHEHTFNSESDITDTAHWNANREAGAHLPLLEFVVVQLLLVGDLLFGRRRQKLELPLLGFPQQLLGGDLNLCRSFVLHLQTQEETSTSM